MLRNHILQDDPIIELDQFLQKKLSIQIPRSDITDLYKKCVSIHQSKAVRKGKALENAVAYLLTHQRIPFLAQACVNKDGLIINGKVGHHRHDFVIDAKIGDYINEKIIISCKTSLRERFLQDANVNCKKLFMVTMDPLITDVKKQALRDQHCIEVVDVHTEDPDRMIRDIKEFLAIA